MSPITIVPAVSLPFSASVLEIGYHGSDSITVNSLLVPGRIDRSQGDGELGQGFYLGNLLFVSRAWAWNKCKSQRARPRPLPAVLRVELSAAAILLVTSMDIVVYTRTSGRQLWRVFTAGNTALYPKGCDIRVSPILGNVIPNLRSYSRMLPQFRLTNRSLREA